MINELKTELATIQSKVELANIKAKYLGKNSALSQMGASMKGLTPEEKKELGLKMNMLKVEVETLIANKLAEIEAALLEAEINKQAVDVTLPGYQLASANLHPLTQIVWEIEDFFVSLGYTVENGPEVENDEYNFTYLNLPKDHPARDMQDSFYFSANELLRTHTSPVQIRTMLREVGNPIKIICPGKVYRRDNDDATHSFQFMQCEGLVVGKNITLADLNGTLDLLLKHLFGKERLIRMRPSYFPFTEPSVEVDISCSKCNGAGCSMCKHTGWIEILGAGMVNAKVLQNCGYDANEFTGFAFGMGIERIAMLKYGLSDIRAFFANDLRFLKKFKGGK